MAVQITISHLTQLSLRRSRVE